jgi:nucleotide-binding universal stress UspA family protein
MIDQVSSYYAKTDRILVPMAKGESSKRAFNLASDFARTFGSQITALTIKDETKEVTWSDKVAVVMNVYKESRMEGLRIIPKIQSARNVKDGIISEINSKNYDLIIMSSRSRSGVSTSLLGGIGDFIIKRSKNTTANISIKRDAYPYRRILVPMSERLNSRKSVYLAAVIAKVLNAKFYLVDARSFDKKKVHGFKTLMNAEIWKDLDLTYDISEIHGDDLRESVLQRLYATSSDLIVLGVRPDNYANVRINSDIKKIIKDAPLDSILIKR